jgi:hypothetical protein
MKGGELRSGVWAEGLELRDVVPNFLAALGLSVPAGVDRPPRRELFRRSLPNSEQMRIDNWEPPQREEFTDGLDQQVAARLHGLGYM